MLNNLRSGFFISLIALPLCLGIAIASSCPPIAGVITAIVGGMIVSLLGGSSLSIKGPAAGLIVIVLGAVVDLGGGDVTLGYKRMLAVALIAGLVQMLFALCRLGQIGRVIPPSIIHGMLAAIGVIILAKQIHILLGVQPHGKTPFELISEIPNSLMNVNPELAFIGIITLILMIGLPLIKNKHFKSMPPALLALLVVIPLSLFWHLDMPHNYSFLNYDFLVGPQYLVSIPKNILTSLVFPDFSILSELAAYKYVAMFALVGSIESVLTVIAVDSIAKTKSNLDRDLFAIGFGNAIAAAIGGLPMISEVVRSRANIDSGATSRWSNFFHGCFLLLFVSLLAPVITEIPLAALAAMLMVTGFRLASPMQFIHTRKIGLDQLVIFCSTLFMTLATDLLMGVLMGVVVKLVIHLSRGVKLTQFFRATIHLEENVDKTRLIVSGPAVFTNLRDLQKNILVASLKEKTIEVDFSKASLIDHTTISCLHLLQDELGGNRLAFAGLDRLHSISTHKFATRR